MCEKLQEEKTGVGHVDSIPLLDCPFCGSDGISTTHWSNPDHHKIQYGCGECEIFFDSPEDWNKRTSNDQHEGRVPSKGEKQ